MDSFKRSLTGDKSVRRGSGRELKLPRRNRANWRPNAPSRCRLSVVKPSNSSEMMWTSYDWLDVSGQPEGGEDAPARSRLHARGQMDNLVDRERA